MSLAIAWIVTIVILLAVFIPLRRIKFIDRFEFKVSLLIAFVGPTFIYGLAALATGFTF